MTCYSPINAWQQPTPNERGKRPIYFQGQVGYTPLQVPCGQCIGCRLERSRQWAIRSTHEASLYTDNCFVTLTFNDDELAKRENPKSLDVRDIQLFLKRLRKHCSGATAVETKDGITYPIRFHACGEYGDLNKRPHYHLSIFNFDFPEKEPHAVYNGNIYYRSPLLEKLWPYGFAIVTAFSFETAAYVARYILKKQTGENAEKKYHHVDLETGEYSKLKPEFTTMSRRPGIAARWFEQFKDDVYPDDFVVLRGKKMRPPKFYDRKLESIEPITMERIREQRIIDAAKNIDNSTDQRLKIREQCKQAAIKRLKRNLDESI